MATGRRGIARAALITVLLIGVTAYVTWVAAGAYYSEQFASLETTTRNLLVQVGQLGKEGGPQTPSVYGSSRLQLMDIHVVFDPPHQPNIFGNVINKGVLAARDPASGAAYLVASSELSPAELDDLAAQAINARIGNRGFGFKPDDVHGFSLEFNMTQEQFDAVKDGKGIFYLVYVVSHVDDATAPGKMRLTETCYVYKGGLKRAQLCPDHNWSGTAPFRVSR